MKKFFAKSRKIVRSNSKNEFIFDFSSRKLCFCQKPPVETKVVFLTALPKEYLVEIWKNFRSKLKRFFNLGFYWTEVSPWKCWSGYVDCMFDILPKKSAESLIIFGSKSETNYKFFAFWPGKKYSPKNRLVTYTEISPNISENSY